MLSAPLVRSHLWPTYSPICRTVSGSSFSPVCVVRTNFGRADSACASASAAFMVTATDCRCPKTAAGLGTRGSGCVIGAPTMLYVAAAAVPLLVK